MEATPITIDHQEMVNFIFNKIIEEGIVVESENIVKVLEYEFDFLRLKGIID